MQKKPLFRGAFNIWTAKDAGVYERFNDAFLPSLLLNVSEIEAKLADSVGARISTAGRLV